MPSTTPFIHEDFLLTTPEARELYHRHASAEPILDYHSHLSAEAIATNQSFSDLAELWLAADHYKWRLMRADGVPESHITGDASALDKFIAWASTVHRALRNPLHHWTALELWRAFGITTPLRPDSANAIWSTTLAALPGLRVHDLLARFNVAALCTTDDPADSLVHHQSIRTLPSLTTRVFPTFRPDRAFALADPAVYACWLDKLADAAGMAEGIHSLDDLLTALRRRHEDFHAVGCRISDHGMTAAFASPCPHAEAAAIFARARTGTAPPQDDINRFGSYLMLEFGRWDAAAGWTKQLHLGPLRNANSRLFARYGADAGADSIDDAPQATALARYLDTLDSTGELPRTILYNLNPRDSLVFATMAGNFQGDGIPGKIQYGSGWWFLDQKDGMEDQLKTFAHTGMLARFIGMTTDSRSFLSFTRHEYFRRILCNLLGSDIASGAVPRDIDLVGSIVRDICFANAHRYFRLDLPGSATTP